MAARRSPVPLKVLPRDALVQVAAGMPAPKTV
jgi:hypothetical protein